MLPSPCRHRWQNPIAPGLGKSYVVREMGLAELLKSYRSLPPGERAIFEEIVRAHQLFNSPGWTREIARRHGEIERGSGQNLGQIETLVERLKREES